MGSVLKTEKHLLAVIMLQIWCKAHRQRQDLLSKAQLYTRIWRECSTDHRRISQLCTQPLIAEPLHICYLKKVIPAAAPWGLPADKSSYLPKKQGVVGAHITIYAHSSNALLCFCLALYTYVYMRSQANVMPAISALSHLGIPQPSLPRCFLDSLEQCTA